MPLPFRIKGAGLESVRETLTLFKFLQDQTWLGPIAAAVHSMLLGQAECDAEEDATWLYC